MSGRMQLVRWELPDPQTWQSLREMAEDLVKSGLLPDHIKTPQAALAIIQKGRELGIPPMYALCNLYVTNGRVACSAELMLALIFRDHGDHAVIIEHSDATRCTIRYKRRSWTEYRTYTFTIEEARRAGLLNRPTWQQYPAAMIRARAISAVARFAFPDTLAGMYTYEELENIVEPEATAVELTDEQVTAISGNEPPAIEAPKQPEPASEPQQEAAATPVAHQEPHTEAHHGTAAEQPADRPRRSRAEAVQGALHRLSKETGVSVDYMLKWLEARHNITDLNKVTNDHLIELRSFVQEMQMTGTSRAMV